MLWCQYISLFVCCHHGHLSSPGFFLVSNWNKKTRVIHFKVFKKGAIFYAVDLEASETSLKQWNVGLRVIFYNLFLYWCFRDELVPKFFIFHNNLFKTTFLDVWKRMRWLNFNSWSKMPFAEYGWYLCNNREVSDVYFLQHYSDIYPNMLNLPGASSGTLLFVKCVRF